MPVGSFESGHIGAGAAAAPPAPAVRVLRPAPLVVGAVSAAAAAAVFGPTPRGLVATFFLGVLGVLAAIDFEHHLLPNKVVLPSAAIVLSAQIAFFPSQALEWTLASAGTFAVLLLVAAIRPGGLGMGDVKLGLLLGAGLGAQVPAALMIGLIAIWPVALWLFLRDGSQAFKRSVPFGPALAFGAAVVMLAGAA